MNSTEENKLTRYARLTLQEECFLFASLMLITCYFLPWSGGEYSAWQLLTNSENVLVVFFLTQALILICITPVSVRLPRARPWIALFAALLVTNALAVSGSASWGSQLMRLFAIAMLLLSARPAINKTSDFLMKRLNSRSAEVFNHWGTALHNIQFSAQEFYAKVEREILARQWPGVELVRLNHSEAGLLSHKREYLRVIRQRQVFDICAGTFGKDYFFTLREAEVQPQLTLATVLIFLFALAMLFFLFVNSLGFITGAINFLTLLVVAFLLMLNALRLGLTRLDGALMRIPVVGPIYETFFRRSTTYFQHDTRVVFLKLMDDVLKAHVDAETSAKGIQLLSCFEHQPVLHGLYELSTRETKPKP